VHAIEKLRQPLSGVFFREGKGGCNIRLIRIKSSFLEALISCLVPYKLQLLDPFEVSPVARNNSLSCSRNLLPITFF